MKLVNQALRFVVVGGLSTAVDFMVYMLLSTKLSITTSKALSMIFASVISYILSKNWTFKSPAKSNSISIIKFYIVFFINLVTNITVNNVVFEISNMKILAFLIATVCAMTVNFLLQRYWVFKR
jgi:putative flippase GtrA